MELTFEIFFFPFSSNPRHTITVPLELVFKCQFVTKLEMPCITDCAANTTPPKSTKSRNSNSSIQIECKTNSMKRPVSWNLLRIRVRSKNTKLHLKSQLVTKLAALVLCYGYGATWQWRRMCRKSFLSTKETYLCQTLLQKSSICVRIHRVCCGYGATCRQKRLGTHAAPRYIWSTTSDLLFDVPLC